VADKKARVGVRIMEKLVERRNAKRLGVRPKAKAMIKKQLTLRYEGLGSKEA